MTSPRRQCGFPMRCVAVFRRSAGDSTSAPHRLEGQFGDALGDCDVCTVGVWSAFMKMACRQRKPTFNRFVALEFQDAFPVRPLATNPWAIHRIVSHRRAQGMTKIASHLAAIS